MGSIRPILDLLTMAGLFIFVVLNANNFGNAVKAAAGAASGYVNAIGRGQ